MKNKDFFGKYQEMFDAIKLKTDANLVLISLIKSRTDAQEMEQIIMPQ